MYKTVHPVRLKLEQFPAHTWRSRVAQRHSAAASGTGMTSAPLSLLSDASSRSASSDLTATGTELYRADSERYFITVRLSASFDTAPANSKEQFQLLVAKVSICSFQLLFWHTLSYFKVLYFMNMHVCIIRSIWRIGGSESKLCYITDGLVSMGSSSKHWSRESGKFRDYVAPVVKVLTVSAVPRFLVVICILV